MPYIKISINTTSDKAEDIAEALMAIDALSVSLEDDGDQALFQEALNENPLWQDISVQALFDSNVSPRDIMAEVKQKLQWQGPLNYKIEKLADEDWVRITQQNFKPQCYANKLWVCPSWYQPQHFDGIVIRIDPGLAFGTGSHETTHLCLNWLAQHNVKDKIVIDYGCGSGILGLAALALGAKKVYAIDHDPQALEASQNNAELNPFISSDNFSTLLNNQKIPAKADIVLANILANPLITLCDTLTAHCKPGGKLLLSGVLEAEQQKVLKPYKKTCDVNTIENKNGWVAIELTP
jgi:ribosomal protein L11 methyltransferase